MNRLVYRVQVSKVRSNQLLGLLWTTLTLAVTDNMNLTGIYFRLHVLDIQYKGQK